MPYMIDGDELSDDDVLVMWRREHAHRCWAAVQAAAAFCAVVHAHQNHATALADALLTGVNTHTPLPRVHATMAELGSVYAACGAVERER